MCYKGYQHVWFQISDVPVHQRLWRQILRNKGLVSIPEVLSKRTFDLMLDEKAVMFCDDTLLHSSIARFYPHHSYTGEFYMGTDYFINNPFTMFLRRSLDPVLKVKIHKR